MVLVVMALVRVENVTVLGVLYLRFCLVVRNCSGSGIGGDGGGWWLFGIGGDGGTVVGVRMVTTALRVAVVIRNNLKLAAKCFLQNASKKPQDIFGSQPPSIVTNFSW